MIRKLDELGRIVIPIEIRKKLELEVGTEVEILRRGNKLIITKYKDAYCPQCLTRCEHTDNYCRKCGLEFRKQ